MFKLAETDALLEEGMLLFPDEPTLFLEYALVPLAPVLKTDRNLPEALRRFSRSCAIIFQVRTWSRGGHMLPLRKRSLR